MKETYKFLAIPVLLVLVLGVFEVFMYPVNAAAQITIVNHQGFVDSSEKYVVYGEVQNNGDQAATNVYLNFTFYDSGHAVLDQGELAIRTTVLLPGRKGPFAAVAGVEATSVASYSVELMNGTTSTDSPPLDLEVVSSTAQFKPTLQSMMLNGTVRNNGAQTASHVKVIITFYDGPNGTGNVVGVASPSTEPTSLSSGETGAFQDGVPVGSDKSYASYVLTAESWEYTSEVNVSATVPEFSPLILLLSLTVVTMTATIVLKKKQPERAAAAS